MTTTLKEGSEATAQASRLLRMPLRAPSPDEGAVDISQGSARVLTFVLATLAVAWLIGCHRNGPASNDNKNPREAQLRTEASRYPYTPPTTSNSRITLRISEGGQTAEVTQLEGHMVRIEKGPRPIWRRGDSEEWTIGLVPSITGPRTARISLLSINAAMDPGQPLFSERAEPLGSYDLAMGAPQAIGKNPTLDVDLLAIATPAESAGARAERVRECCVGCGALHVCAISVVLNCGGCKVLDEGGNEHAK
jgi:hypothetical protein